MSAWRKLVAVLVAAVSVVQGAAATPGQAPDGTQLPQEALTGIHDDAKLVMEKLTPLRQAPIVLDRDSVVWVEGFIERQRLDFKDDHEGLVQTLGSFLGESIIAAGGGTWAKTDDDMIGVKFANGAWCFPFAKVRKQFANGLDGGDSIASFYDISIKEVATGKLATGAEANAAKSDAEGGR